MTLADTRILPFGWNGSDEGDEIYGEAPTGLNDDGSIDIEL